MGTRAPLRAPASHHGVPRSRVLQARHRPCRERRVCVASYRAIAVPRCGTRLVGPVAPSIGEQGA